MKRKVSEANRKYWADHPDELAARGAQLRGENHYKWKGGASKLNTAIRQMTENRKWMDAVKERDAYKCVRCRSGDQLESHHKIELADLIEQNNIKSCADARSCPALWDLSNGETLCQKCHYAEHGRIYRADNSDNLQLVA